MSKIHVLDQSVANMIAAGEVVERPASVVKELLENSFDAGAKSITVEIKNGGVSYIRVTDDGHGMDSDDVKTAFLPHATSKILNAEDITTIRTYGFRGEALSSIASVSKVELITKTESSEEGTRLIIEGGEYVDISDIGTPKGTTIIVRDIFYNTPARFKFLKKDSAEMASVTDVCQKAALSRPDVSLRYVSSGKDIFFTPGDNMLINAIYTIFGADFAKHMLPVKYESDGYKVQGFIGTAAAARPNRNMQIMFVNGRSVVNRTLSFALSESYKNQLTVGKFPSAVLNINMSPLSVDVNVHPAKIEVKFSDEHSVYDAVYWACKNTLYEKPYVPLVETGAQKYGKDIKHTEEKADKLPLTYSNVKKDNIDAYVSGYPKTASQEKTNPGSSNSLNKEHAVSEALGSVQYKQEVHFRPAFDIKADTVNKADIKQEEKKLDLKVEPVIQQSLGIASGKDVNIIGQVFNTYIIAQHGDEMLLMDQHAAHERLKYEELKEARKSKQKPSQILLSPLIVNLASIEFLAFEENDDFFASIGYEMEAIGGSDVMVRAVPMGIEESKIKDTLIELLTILKDAKKDKRTYFEERAMYTVACKAAIKANKVMSVREQEQLVSDVLKLEGINTCPHGRPVCIKMTKEKIEKEFKRL
ncbi:MAG: DNA mismatch repair endonuclease MutL [Bacillota bacterium]|nr:DNA mismatch repair endonuclease MutL [Bacillota bacterium]